MKLSTKSRYALEGLLYLALQDGNSPVNIKEIAGGTGITVAYLEQIFFQLKKAGLVATERGTKGGYFLALSEKEITVASVIRSIEGSLVPIKCVENPDLCTSKARHSCSSRAVWVQVSDAIVQTAEQITLQELKDGYINGGTENETVN